MSAVNQTVAFRELEHDLRLLAAPGQLQTAWVMAERVPYGELVWQFDDTLFVFVPGLIEDGLIEYHAVQAIRALEAQLDIMRESGDELLWDSTAEFHHAPEWQRIRNLARTALVALGMPVEGYDVVARFRPGAIFNAVRDIIVWLAQPAAGQKDWLNRSLTSLQDYPLILDDLVTVFVPRLLAAGLISPVAADAAYAGRDFVRAAVARTDPALNDPTVLTTSPTWITLRRLARTAARRLVPIGAPATTVVR